MTSHPSARYFTDGTRLYEVVSERTTENAVTGGLIRELELEDCVSGAPARAGGLDLAVAPVPTFNVESRENS